MVYSFDPKTRAPIEGDLAVSYQNIEATASSNSGRELFPSLPESSATLLPPLGATPLPHFGATPLPPPEAMPLSGAPNLLYPQTVAGMQSMLPAPLYGGTVRLIYESNNPIDMRPSRPRSPEPKLSYSAAAQASEGESDFEEDPELVSLRRQVEVEKRRHAEADKVYRERAEELKRLQSQISSKPSTDNRNSHNVHNGPSRRRPRRLSNPRVRPVDKDKVDAWSKLAGEGAEVEKQLKPGDIFR